MKKLYGRDYSQRCRQVPPTSQGVASDSPGMKGVILSWSWVEGLSYGSWAMVQDMSPKQGEIPEPLSPPSSLSCWCLMGHTLRLGGVSISGPLVRSVHPDSSRFWHHIVCQSLQSAVSVGPHLRLPGRVAVSKSSSGPGPVCQQSTFCQGQKFIYFIDVLPFFMVPGHRLLVNSTIVMLFILVSLTIPCTSSKFVIEHLFLSMAVFIDPNFCIWHSDFYLLNSLLT